MRAHHRPQHHEGLHEAVQACLTLGSRWVGPTLGEFIERAEHEFGADRSLAARMLTGLGPGDNLTASDVRELCDQLGVPAADFGVEP